MGFYDFTLTDGKGNEVKTADYQNNSDIKWNFTKFVIDREGSVVARFEPTAPMDDVAACVRSLI